MNILNTLRDLWWQQIIWMRELIVNICCNFFDTSFIIQNLSDNVQNSVNYFMKYYGYSKSKVFGTLFMNFISITIKMLDDLKTGNTAAADTDRIKWYKSADEIAGFLSSINPYWDEQEWQVMLYKYIDIIESETIYRLKMKCATNITTDEKVENLISRMTDYTANGIIQQFNI